MDSAPSYSLGGTYGGNPVACAAALAVLDVMEEEKIPEKAAKIGTHMQKRLNEMAIKHKVIGDVRVLGGLVAIELFEDGDLNKPAPEKTAKLLVSARDKGLVILTCGVNANVVRFLPPLTIEHNVLDEGLDIIAECLEEIG